MQIAGTLLLVVLLVAGSYSKKGYGPGEQEYGFIEVRPGAHTFYWLFYTKANVPEPESRPLVLWLQGGPGASSMYGNWAELGPLHLNLTDRASSWDKQVNLMFIDNPVGTGYSYVEDYSLFTTTNEEIGRDLTSFMIEFYSLYPKFQTTPTYIFCESYGGKMVIEFAKQLQAEIQNRPNGVIADFRGVALGDSWISPIDSVLTWGPYLLNAGIVDQQGYEAIQKSAQSVQDAIDAGNWDAATSRWGQTEGVVGSVSGNVDFYNILKKIPSSKKHHAYMHMALSRGLKDADDDRIYELMNGEVKEALGIPEEREFEGQSGYVFPSLNEDFMKPVTSVVEEVLNNTQLDVYVSTGNLDLIVDTPGTLQWVDRLKWSGASQWKTARRRNLVVDGYIEGFYKEVDTLHFYWIERAGHMVPNDNPWTALEFLRRVTKYDQL